MKKKILKIYFILTMILLSFENTYAYYLNTDTTILLYLLCGLFIFIGIIIIIFGKITSSKNKVYNKKNKKNEITGIIDKNNIDKKFNSDSIFKTLPNFSNQNFYEKTFEDLKDNLKKENNLININTIIVIKKDIIDFKNELDKYIITSEFIINYENNNKTGELNIKNKYEEKYIITSEKQKKDTTHSNCPTCGGKIKDPTLLRCKYCDTIIAKTNSNTKNDWEITNIKKMDK